jgi:hypothetical protein
LLTECEGSANKGSLPNVLGRLPFVRDSY